MSERDRHRRAASVLRGVLHRLETAEVRGCLHVLWVPADPVGLHRHRDGRAASLGGERRGQALVGQERRVDASGQVAQGVQRLLSVSLHVVEQGLGAVQITTSEVLGQPELHGEGHQLLLRAVVDVALEPAAFGVGRRDDPLARRPQLLDQAGVAQHQPGLSGEVADQLLLGLGQPLASGLGDGEGTQQLALVANRKDAVGTRDRWNPSVDDRHCRRIGCFIRPGPRDLEFRADPHPDVRAACADPFADRSGHLGQEVVSRVAGPDAIGELGKDFIGRGALAEHQPVGEMLSAGPHRLEGHRDHHGGQKGEERVGAGADDGGPDPNNQRRIHQRDEHRQGPHHDRPVDDEVDVVEPVLQDGDPRADRHGHDAQVEEDIEPPRIAEGDAEQDVGRRDGDIYT